MEVIFLCTILLLLICILIVKLFTQRRKRIKRIKKICNLEKKYNYPKKQKINLFEVLAIARHYHIGIDDTYNTDGTLIKGIPPNAAKAIKYYTIAGKLGYTKAYYEIGAIYENGCGDYNGSIPAALNYYQSLYKKGYIRNNEIVNRIRILSAAVERKRKDLIVDNLRDDIKHNNREQVLTEVLNAPPIDIEFDQNLEDAIVRATQQIVAPTPILGNVYSDAQNTHDSTLNATIRDAVSKIESQQIPINENAIEEIEKFINENLQKDKKSNALRTLDKIKRNDSAVSSLNKTEKEVANLIWSRINHADNKDYQQELKENFCDYLAESVENGKVCCPTGRVNRMVDSLNVVDPLVTLKSTSVINQELMNKAGVIRNKLYEELPEETRKKVDSPDDSDVSTQFTNDTKTAILKMVNEEYVKPGIVSEDAAAKITSQWIDAI